MSGRPWSSRTVVLDVANRVEGTDKEPTRRHAMEAVQHEADSQDLKVEEQKESRASMGHVLEVMRVIWTASMERVPACWPKGSGGDAGSFGAENSTKVPV